MARTIQEIKKEMTDAFVADSTLQTAYGLTPGKSFDEEFSKLSMESIFFYIVATSIWALEQVLELTVRRQNEFIRESKIHSTTWYSDMAKRFQYGYGIPQNDYGGLNRWDVVYDVIDEDKQVVKFASVTAGASGLMVKVAGLDGSDMAQLGNSEFAAFKDYMERVKAAGDFLNYRNADADDLKIKLKVWVDGLVIGMDGKRLDGSDDEPIRHAVESYLKGIDFNGKLVEQDLVDALQAVDGVRIIDVESLQTKYGGVPYTNVPPEGVIPFAGYVRIDSWVLVVEI